MEDYGDTSNEDENASDDNIFHGQSDSDCEEENFVTDMENDKSSITNKLSSIDCDSSDESQLSKTTLISRSPKKKPY